MARGTKGLSAQYKKEMSRINRLTYGARKRGYEFNIPFKETRYGLSKLRQITSVKQLYKYSSKVTVSPLSGEVRKFRGDLAREFERQLSARRSAVIREVNKYRNYNIYNDVALPQKEVERLLEVSLAKSQYNYENWSAKNVVKEALIEIFYGVYDETNPTYDFINSDTKINREEPIKNFDDIDELFNDLKNNPPDPQTPPEGIDFEDEEPISSEQPDEEEEPAMDYDTAEQWIDEFIDEARFHDTRVYWAVKDLIDKAIDDFDIFTVANRLQAAYADGVMQKLYEQSKPKEEGAVDTTELEEYLNAEPSSARLEDLSDGYDPFAGQSDNQNFYNYYG